MRGLRPVLLFTSLMVAGAAAACGGSSPESTSPASSSAAVDAATAGRITGRVVRAGTNDPVANAKVRVAAGLSRFKDRSLPTSKPQQSTEASGAFVFTGLKDGPVTLEVSHAEFGTRRVEGVDTQVAEKSLDLLIELEQAGEISGVVQDPRAYGALGPDGVSVPHLARRNAGP